MATYTAHNPVSSLLRQGSGTGEIEGRQSKEEYRRMKELEEERKAGTAPAMVDVDTGRDINPHIPQFISQNPWYVPSTGPTLKHQRPHPERQIAGASMSDWYNRGVTTKVASKFRKGACENCGAMTHKMKDCFERPRKTGAKWTGDDIAPDEFLQPRLSMGWEAKRDRWNGYDPAEHRHVVEEFEKLEETRKLIKAEQIKESDAKEEEDEVAEDDEDKYAESADMAGVTVDMDSRTRITVRNLRIREDTAKYLYNLDPNGPYYDPKSRSMRENPFQGVPGKEAEAVKFSGENFVRYTGEVVDANEAQVFAWQARQKGIDVHALAEPTKLEALRREFKDQKGGFKSDQKKTIIDKYGGEEHLKAPPKELLLAQTEHYVEYNRRGKVIKGEDRPVIRSRYDEDKFINNHTAVWGSFWKTGQWGYACCHSSVKNSYCIGKKGHEVNGQLAPIVPVKRELEKAREGDEGKAKGKGDADDASSSDESSSSSSSSDSSSSDEKKTKKVEENDDVQREREKRERDSKRREKKRDKRRRQKQRRNEKVGGAKKNNDSEEDEEKDPSELERALRAEEKKQREAERIIQEGDRKRKYNTTYEVKVPTTVEMEAYHLRALHSSDPMANYMEEKRRKH